MRLTQRPAQPGTSSIPPAAPVLWVPVPHGIPALGPLPAAMVSGRPPCTTTSSCPCRACACQFWNNISSSMFCLCSMYSFFSLCVDCLLVLQFFHVFIGVFFQHEPLYLHLIIPITCFDKHTFEIGREIDKCHTEIWVFMFDWIMCCLHVQPNQWLDIQSVFQITQHSQHHSALHTTHCMCMQPPAETTSMKVQEEQDFISSVWVDVDVVHWW